MILNNADNIMLGGSEVDRVYCGSVVVWQRGGNIPAEVLAYAQDIITHYNLSGEIGIDYSLLYNNQSNKFLFHLNYLYYILQ